MVRSIPGPSKKISTYDIDTNKMAKVMREIALEKKSNSNTSNTSKGSKHNPKQVITKSKSALENGVRSQITNRESSNSSSNNSINIRSDTDYQIFYGVDSSSIGSTMLTLNNLNSMNGVRTASLDTVEISGESRQLFATKSSNNKYLDIAGTVFDIVTDFIPGVGTAKDIYNVYQTIVNPKSKVADIALALVDLVPGPSVSKLKKFADVIINKFNLNSSTAKKLTDALVKTSAAKIRKMDINDTKKLVNASEGKGLSGHTKKTHLEITDEVLQNRSKTKAKKGASKFSSNKVMNEFINTVLVKDADKIASWLKSNTTRDYTSGIHKSNSPLGYGFKYNNKKNSYVKSDKLNTGLVVLEKNTNNEYGFIVKTAYPLVK